MSMGSSLKLCLVAEEKRLLSKICSNNGMGYSAGHAICKFAGCKLTDLKTKQEMIYNRKN
ncbi:MAG: hypothetical protein CM15mP23_15220 [Cryomorphaceae bacterium]|nr:MAG: hypothetical protein CM15mP23_15220 [Cryomorphaceae bacterium]